MEKKTVRGLLASVALALTAVIGLTGCATATLDDVSLLPSVTAEPTPISPAATPPPAAGVESDALALLDTLAVKGRAPKTGYDREGQFGTAWIDVDRDGCDTRNQILQRDLTNIVLDGSCKVLSGTLADPFTGTTIQFLRGNKTSTLVHIEHIVALSDGWQKGAQQLTQEQRIQFANDPLHLRAVDGPTNSAKGDGDAATWLPPNKSYRCEYVATQIQVKAKYSLWVTQAERDAMIRVLGQCGDQPINAPQPVPVPPVAAEPAPVVPDAPADSSGATVHPGSFCSEQGATGVSKAGKTYTCGKNGPDAGGRFHWNS